MDKITYRQQVVPCDDPACRRCRKGLGHGPYWYAYSTDEQGQSRRSYVGKKLPPEGQVASNPSPHESEQVRRILPHHLLLQALIGEQYDGGHDELRVYVRHLRLKVEEVPSHSRYIQTAPGIGYAFCHA